MSIINDLTSIKNEENRDIIENAKEIIADLAHDVKHAKKELARLGYCEDEVCVCCGAIVPEGRQYCPKCGSVLNE